MRARAAAAVMGLLAMGLVALGAAGGGAAERPAAPPDGDASREADLAPPQAAQQAERTGARKLMSALGCGACHRGVPEPAEARQAAPTFGPDGPARPPDSLLAVLLSASPRRTAASAARMPDFHLSPAEALALTLFLETTLPDAGEGGRERLEELREAHPSVDAELGRRLFLALDCAGCHGGTDVPAWKSAPDLSSESERARRGWLTSWLARPTAVRPYGFYPGTGTRMPDFGLSDAELRTLVDHLAPPDAGSVDGTAGRPPAADPLSPFREAQAERLLAERSACLGCHARAGEGGRVAPDLVDVRLRRPDAYVWAMLRDPGGTRSRSVMPESPADPVRDTLFYRLLTAGEGAHAPGELTGEPTAGRTPGGETAGPGGSGRAPPRHAGYLDLVSHPVRAPDPWMLQGRPTPGTPAARYRHRCASCHGVAGGGDGFNARYLRVPPAAHADSAAMAVRTDARLFNGVHGGGRVLGRSPRMPAFGASLSREATWGLVGRIRELCDCRGPAWHRDNDESGVRGDPGRSDPGGGRR